MIEITQNINKMFHNPIRSMINTRMWYAISDTLYFKTKIIQNELQGNINTVLTEHNFRTYIVDLR